MSRHTVSPRRNPSHPFSRPVTPIGWNGPILDVHPLAIVPLAIALMCPVAAHAGPCSEEIARVELALSQAQANRQIGPSAPESAGALLHRQPTPETVARAQTEAEKNTDAALALARKLNAEGKDSECVAALEKGGVPLGVH
jgi:hypothetical protein